VQEPRLLKLPLPELVKLTLPPGRTAVPVSLSLTITVQVLGALTGTEAGAQVTAVDVERLATVKAKELELLIE
jgi:hypothetical protein